MAKYPSIEVGDLITADLLTSMQEDSYTKLSTTSRNTTTTYAADPELTGIALAAGTYDIDFLGFFTASTTAQLIETQWGFTGTVATFVRNTSGPGNASTGAPEALSAVTLRGWGNTQDARYGLSTSAAFTAIRETARGVVVSAPGSLSFQWRPTASSANNINFQPGSNFTIKRVG